VNDESALDGTSRKFSGVQQFFLACLRVIVGWHFLYEGWVKITQTGWSSAGYLRAAQGPFAAFFTLLARTPWIINVVDWVMAWGLALAGVMLMLGLFTRLGGIIALVFLLLFYLSNPPWIGVQFMPGEGSYLIVNKNLVELAAVMILLVFPAGLAWGFDRLFANE